MGFIFLIIVDIKCRPIAYKYSETVNLTYKIVIIAKKKLYSVQTTYCIII